jgi:transposase-like protein
MIALAIAAVPSIIEFMGVQFCRAFHRGLFFGGGSSYTCAVCMRRYQTPWSSRIEPGVYVRRGS